METTFVLKKEELTMEFLESLKKMFSNSNRLQISVSNPEDFELYKKETNEEYIARLDNARQDTNKVSFSEEEFDNLVKEHLR